MNMDSLPLSRSHTILRVDHQHAVQDTAEVVVEHALQVLIANEKAFTLSCSPAHLEELVVGALFSRRLISSASDIEQIAFSTDFSQVWLTLIPPTVRRPPVPTANVPHLETSLIYHLMERNLTASSLFQRTGGMHCVSLYLPGSPLISIEDLARHNAVDKVIGHALLHGLPLEQAVLVVSGRLSADMLEKAATASIPVVLSKGAPTDRAISMAQARQITLAGFVRGERMNLYTEPGRIEIFS